MPSIQLQTKVLGFVSLPCLLRRSKMLQSSAHSSRTPTHSNQTYSEVNYCKVKTSYFTESDFICSTSAILHLEKRSICTDPNQAVVEQLHASMSDALAVSVEIAMANIKRIVASTRQKWQKVDEKFLRCCFQVRLLVALFVSSKDRINWSFDTYAVRRHLHAQWGLLTKQAPWYKCSSSHFLDYFFGFFHWGKTSHKQYIFHPPKLDGTKKENVWSAVIVRYPIRIGIGGLTAFHKGFFCLSFLLGGKLKVNELYHSFSNLPLVAPFPKSRVDSKWFTAWFPNLGRLKMSNCKLVVK